MVCPLILQKMVLRFITGSSQTDSCIPIFKNKRILTVYSLYVFKIVLIVKNNCQIKNLNVQSPKHPAV